MSGGLRVGELAEAAGVGTETVRYYERRGVLPPPERTLGGHRVYTDATVLTLRAVKAAQRLGFTLDEVVALFAGGLRDRTEDKLAEVDRRIADLQLVRAGLVAARDAGCDDLITCAGTDSCPIPFGDARSA